MDIYFRTSKKQDVRLVEVVYVNKTTRPVTVIKPGNTYQQVRLTSLFTLLDPVSKKEVPYTDSIPPAGPPPQGMFQNVSVTLQPGQEGVLVGLVIYPDKKEATVALSSGWRKWNLSGLAGEKLLIKYEYKTPKNFQKELFPDKQIFEGKLAHQEVVAF